MPSSTSHVLCRAKRLAAYSVLCIHTQIIHVYASHTLGLGTEYLNLETHISRLSPVLFLPFVQKEVLEGSRNISFTRQASWPPWSQAYDVPHTRKTYMRLTLYATVCILITSTRPEPRTQHSNVYVNGTSYVASASAAPTYVTLGAT